MRKYNLFGGKDSCHLSVAKKHAITNPIIVLRHYKFPLGVLSRHLCFLTVRYQQQELCIDILGEATKCFWARGILLERAWWIAVCDLISVHWPKLKIISNNWCMWINIIFIDSDSDSFIWSYCRPRRPLLRPNLVAVAEATWKKIKYTVYMYVQIIVIIKSIS